MLVGAGRMQVLLEGCAGTDLFDDTRLTACVCLYGILVSIVWAHKDLGSATDSYKVTGVGGHDCAFLVLSP